MHGSNLCQWSVTTNENNSWFYLVSQGKCWCNTMIGSKMHVSKYHPTHKSSNHLPIHQSSYRWTLHSLLCYSSSSSSSSSSLGATALREPWPPVLFASTGLYPELSFSILQSSSLVGPLERHLATLLLIPSEIKPQKFPWKLYWAQEQI